MIEDLQKNFPDLKLSFDRPYRELTTLGVGGTLPVLAEPASEAELSGLLKYLRRKHIKFFILGNGSNLVGMDAPYDGVGVRLERQAFANIRCDGTRLVCGARALLPEVAALAAKAGLSGLAQLSGIPGSLGGALRMNASCRGHAIGDLVAEVAGVDFSGEPWRARGAELAWEYRKGGIPDDVVVTSVTLELIPGDPATEHAALEVERAKRRETEPAGRTAGCVFRNVSPEEPAGMLIDRCGLRGTRIGGVEVSEKHANYLVNVTGRAGEREFLTVAKLARTLVRERFGHELRPEVRFISEASMRELTGGERPGSGEANAVLVLVCRWFFRLTCVLAAAALVALAFGIRRTSNAAAAALVAGAALLILSEAVYSILKYAEKK